MENKSPDESNGFLTATRSHYNSFANSRTTPLLTLLLAQLLPWSHYRIYSPNSAEHPSHYKNYYKLLQLLRAKILRDGTWQL